MDDRRMEIKVLYQPPLGPVTPKVEHFNALDRIVENMKSVEENLRVHDAVVNLLDMAHDLNPDCTCTDCDEFARLRSALKDG